MELAHLPYKKEIYEDYVGIGGLKQHGKKRWRRHVLDIVEHLIATLKPADAVPCRRQRERIHWRISAVGTCRWRPTTC